MKGRYLNVSDTASSEASEDSSEMMRAERLQVREHHSEAAPGASQE